MPRDKEKSLEELKKAIESIKEDIATKKGERQAELNTLKKEHGLKDLDDGYKLLQKLEVEIEDKQRDKDKLLDKAWDQLKEFGYV